MSSVPSVRQLRAFVAIYHGGKLAIAAEALSLTQPAVSVLLRELEERLGVRLFDRTTRTLHRTQAAMEAIGFAERVLDELDGMGAAMGALAQGVSGHVRIAATSAIAQTLIPAAMRAYQVLHPQVKVSMDDCAPNQFVGRVQSEQVDFGVGTLDASVPGLVERVIIKDHLSVVAHKSISFPHSLHMTWGQLATQPLITVKSGYGIRASIDRAAAEADVVLQVMHEVTLLGTALAMVANGLGVSVLPVSLMRQAAYPNLVARRLVRPTVVRNIAVVTKADRSISAAAQSFISILAAGSP